MSNFWNNRSRPAGPLFGKKSGVTEQTPPPPPAAPSGTVPAAKTSAVASPSSVRASAISSSSSGSYRSKMRYDHDFACGVFVGAFDIPGWVVSLEVLEVTDATSGRVDRVENWLKPNDMLAILTKEFGKARQKASAVAIKPDAPPQQRSQLTKERDEWTRRMNEMRDQVVCLLQTRHVYVRAKELGVKELIPAP